MSNFCDMDKIALEHGIVNVDGVLLDIGVSSYQSIPQSAAFPTTPTPRSICA